MTSPAKANSTDRLKAARAAAPPLTAARLREVMSYDPETGFFTIFARLSAPTRTTPGFLGKRGAYVLRIDYRLYYAHRLAWLHMTGDWPSGCIDHIDGDASNNKWANLRHASHAQNMANQKKRKDNTSGYKGVTFDKRSGKWLAQIQCERKHSILGRFDNPKAAHDAYCAAANALFGKFARAA